MQYLARATSRVLQRDFERSIRVRMTSRTAAVEHSFSSFAAIFGGTPQRNLLAWQALMSLVTPRLGAAIHGCPLRAFSGAS